MFCKILFSYFQTFDAFDPWNDVFLFCFASGRANTNKLSQVRITLNQERQSLEDLYVSEYDTKKEKRIGNKPYETVCKKFYLETSK